VEGFVVLIILVVLAVPVVAVAALVRAANVRREMEESAAEQASRVRDLAFEVATLRRGVADLKAEFAAAKPQDPAAPAQRDC
jgi:outer membrane murein-binding lipoprotein Lpp